MGERGQSDESRSREERLQYPERPLVECVDAVWRLVDRRRTVGVDPDLFARVMGLRAGSEHLRGLALAMRSLGLVKPAKDGLRLSQLAIELVQETAGSARHRRLLWETLHTPRCYAPLPDQFPRIVPGYEKLASFFVDAFKLNRSLAEEAAVHYRDGLYFGGLMGPGGERLVPELRVLPRYDPTDAELQAVLPIQEGDTYPTPPELPVRATPPPIPAYRGSGGSPDGHHFELDLGQGRTAAIHLPSDITSEEMKRVIQLLKVLGSTD